MSVSAPVLSPSKTAAPPRISPVPMSALLLTVVLATLGVVASVATHFTFSALPNITLLVTGVVILDVATQYAPQSRMIVAIQTVLYGFLYLAVTIVCGVLAAYALQRFALPLRDQFYSNADMMLGFRWTDFAHWVDEHPLVQATLHTAYNSILPQTALPLAVLGFTHRIAALRGYLLAFSIAFVLTIVISALLPAGGPIVFVDRAAFGLLQFTGATPLDHLALLRQAGPLVFDEAPGGIATFPSFHATIAVLTPLTLRGFPRLFVALVILDAFMLAGTLTEGAHYLIDVVAGTAMAFFAHTLAARIIASEDRIAFLRGGSATRGPVAAQPA
jgi:hypothetical protein